MKRHGQHPSQTHSTANLFRSKFDRRAFLRLGAAGTFGSLPLRNAKEKPPTMNTVTKTRRRSSAALCLLLLAPAVALAQQAPSAATRLNELGPENSQLAQRAGTWDVTETVWDGPKAAPVVTTGLVAERRIIGSLLQEEIRPPADASGKDIMRMDLLTFNRVEGRWDYVSFDIRAPVGLMPAWSSVRGDGATIDLTFAPFAVAGPGTEVTGQLLRMEQVIKYEGPDREVKDQYFMLADGTGTKWLAHRYAYVRRP
jgi:hypothetical protein